ncbi:CPBP family intramembrane glutamic endopeptidase [Parasphingopyxis marina]|uniref:CPBP family intramembrane metalloprotease n=1 Tax=Parasphingopyxis marina TaxID=2761622 RepID=A0A842HWB7_9SPHN|nr:CPBP family intramembrane glutamic endopeptidase [Parasphingopyxis marina]MBC2776717.1 CPBP family intramembrane metalloprotease [Parasphingopyxis marina]
MPQGFDDADVPIELPQQTGRWTAMRDLLLVVTTLVLVKQLLLPITQLYAGPASTLSAMIFATLLLRRRGMGWRDLGLRWPENWLKTLGLTLLTMAFFLACTQLMVPVADHFFEDIGTSDRFSHIEDNLAAYLLIMLVVWTHGSFFEELLFRAFIINHTSEAIGGRHSADILALFLSSAFFGYRHAYYQGWHGALVTGAGGFAFGVLYLWFGRRNILPLILAHGAFNTLGQTLRFFGIED